MKLRLANTLCLRAAPDELRARMRQLVGSHQLLNAEEERELTRDAQRLTRLEALAAPEVERLGRKLLMHEWAELAGEPDVAAFNAHVQVPLARCSRAQPASSDAAACAAADGSAVLLRHSASSSLPQQSMAVHQLLALPKCCLAWHAAMSGCVHCVRNFVQELLICGCYAADTGYCIVGRCVATRGRG